MHCVRYWYWNFRSCSSEQQPLKIVGKTEFWNWNNFILRGEFTFDLKLHSHKYPSVKMNLESGHNYLWWKYGFKIRICTYGHYSTVTHAWLGHCIATRAGVESSSELNYYFVTPGCDISLSSLTSYWKASFSDPCVVMTILTGSRNCVFIDCDVWIINSIK